MAEFSGLVITNIGQALLAKMMTGEGNIEFTKVSVSDEEYTLEDIEDLTELSGVKQTVPVSKVTQTNGVAVTIETTFDNMKLTEGYHMRALGLYAIDPDDGEILYAVTAEMSGCCYMPAYNGVTVSGACIKMVTTVGNAENVSLEVDPGVYATVGEIKELRESVDGIETWKDNTQKRLDNWGPTIVGHGQVINNNRDRISALETRVEEAEQSVDSLQDSIRFQTVQLTIRGREGWITGDCYVYCKDENAKISVKSSNAIYGTKIYINRVNPSTAIPYYLNSKYSYTVEDSMAALKLIAAEDKDFIITNGNKISEISSSVKTAYRLSYDDDVEEVTIIITLPLNSLILGIDNYSRLSGDEAGVSYINVIV